MQHERQGQLLQQRLCGELLPQLKVECVHGERFRNRAQMRETVFEYIEIDYNRQRRHSTLGHISPLAFEARMSA
jgi:putative transposase